MKIFGILGLTATLMLSTSSVVSAKQHIDLPEGGARYIPGRYVVEFSGTDVKNDVTKLFDSIKKDFKDAKLSLADSYAHELFYGASIQVDNLGEYTSSGISAMSEDSNGLGDIVESIISQAHVSGVYPVRVIPRPNLVPMVASGGDGTDYSQLIPHAMTQVDKVHKELKNTGKGIVVGVIDSGVDYRHPALGGGFGPGHKIAYGYDLVGDDYSSESGNPPKPGPTPLDNCGAASGASGHGTHVSGIIAGKADNFTGVAPDATLGMWRVFGCNGSTGDDIIMKAMIAAYDAGVDIISMSLGDNSGWSEAPTAVLGQRIAKKGIPVVVAASNSGEYGAETLGSPTTGHGVLSVASVDNDYYLVQYFTSSASSSKYVYQISSPSVGNMPKAQVAAGDKNVGSSSDACTASNVPSDIKGKIALVKRGSCTFDVKSANVAKAGAVGLLVYNSEQDQAFAPSTPASKIPVAGISISTGKAILEQIKAGKAVTLEFDPVAKIAKYPTGNTVSSFSSVGPTYENDLKPEIAGIGGFVYSTLPLYLGGWGVMSGTSMATPYVSGSIALYLKSLDGKKKSPAFISEQFENYATQLLHENGASGIDTPLRQGAGLVQVYDTILQGGHVSPGKISFNDTNTKDYIRHTLTVKNFGKTTATYNVVNNVSVALVPYDVDKSGYEFIEPAGFSSAVSAKLKFSKTKFTLKPGASTKVTVTVTPPKSDPSKHIMYGGFVQFQSKQVKDISVPYFGIVGKQHELPLFNQNSTFIADAELTTAYGYDDTFVFKRGDNNTQPIIIYSLYTGTAHITAELYTEKGKRLGLAQTGLDYIPRNSGEYPYSQLPWDGTYTPTIFDFPLPFTLNAPKGTYRIKWTGLRLLGNPKNKKDLETWESCLIKIE